MKLRNTILVRLQRFCTSFGIARYTIAILVVVVEVVAQLVEWSLPIPEVRSLNPIIGKNLY